MALITEMLEVCPCNSPNVHGEHIYEWAGYDEFIFCPGRTTPAPAPARFPARARAVLYVLVVVILIGAELALASLVLLGRSTTATNLSVILLCGMYFAWRTWARPHLLPPAAGRHAPRLRGIRPRRR